MPAEVATDCRVYWCVVCGPCIAESMDDEGSAMVVHQDVPHRDEVLFTDEEGGHAH